MNSRIDPKTIRHQINNLLVQYPELADDEQLRADTIEGETNLDEALRSFIRKIGETECSTKALDEYAKQIYERKARLERRAEAYRALILDLMQTAGLRNKELPEATLSVRNVPPKVIVTDDNSVPEELCRVIKKPDITKIKEILIKGEICPGAVLGNGSEALTIRIK